MIEFAITPMIYLIYASTSGNVEVVMETIGEVLRHRGINVMLSRAEKTPAEVLMGHTTFIFGTSTWEHGRLNPYFETVYKQIQTMDCQGKRAAFVGLGDRRYEPVLFCEGMEQVRAAWLKQGGQEIGSPLKIQGEPYDQLEIAVKPWAELVASDWTTHHE
jgi:flavodoxin I